MLYFLVIKTVYSLCSLHYYINRSNLAKALVKRTQVAASRNCVETCVGWPNGFASLLASSRKSQKTHFKVDISFIFLTYQ